MKKVQSVIIYYDDGTEEGYGFHYMNRSDFLNRSMHRDLIIKKLYEHSFGKLIPLSLKEVEFKIKTLKETESEMRKKLTIKILE